MITCQVMPRQEERQERSIEAHGIWLSLRTFFPIPLSQTDRALTSRISMAKSLMIPAPNMLVSRHGTREILLTSNCFRDVYMRTG